MAYGKGGRVNDPQNSQHEKTSTLPPPLQRIIDRADEDEAIYDDYWAGRVPDASEPTIRYAAYALRIKTLLQSMQRYVAYASDVHEPLRPVAHPYLIPAAYAISWGYVVGDAVHEGHKASRFNAEASKSRRLRQPEQGPHRASYKSPAAHDVSTTKARTFPILEDHRIVAMQRILFHSMASMALPAFTVRYIVKYTNRATKGLKSQLLRTSGPIGLSLSAMSVFPYVFDKPVEDAVEWIFYEMLKKFGGQEAVGDALKIGRRNQLRKREAKLLKEGQV